MHEIHSAEDLARECGADYDASEGDPRDFSAAKPFFDAGYKFIGCGCYRAVFELGDHDVLKVPLTPRGVEANEREAEVFKLGGFPLENDEVIEVKLAPCRLMDINGIEVLVMTRVRPVNEIRTQAGVQDVLPDWVALIDDEQVGYLPDGTLVAYDL